MKKIFPLGSECFINWRLNYVPCLKQHKIFYTPFNGCRILNGFNPYFPQREFLLNRNKFLENYYNRDNWELVTDGQDIEAINRKVNLRRCHLTKDGLIEEVIQKVKESVEKTDFDNQLYIINMCPDFLNYYDFKAFQHECRDNNIKIMFLYQDKFKDYVDTTMENAYNMGEENNLRIALDTFYSTRYDEILKRL